MVDCRIVMKFSQEEIEKLLVKEAKAVLADRNVIKEGMVEFCQDEDQGGISTPLSKIEGIVAFESEFLTSVELKNKS